jgi:hypothetical protein
MRHCVGRDGRFEVGWNWCGLRGGAYRACVVWCMYSVFGMGVDIKFVWCWNCHKQVNWLSNLYYVFFRPFSAKQGIRAHHFNHSTHCTKFMNYADHIKKLNWFHSIKMTQLCVAAEMWSKYLRKTQSTFLIIIWELWRHLRISSHDLWHFVVSSPTV